MGKVKFIFSSANFSSGIACRSRGQKISLLFFNWIILSMFLSHSVFADSWTTDAGREYKPSVQENRIVKWCEIEGENVRWASANLEIKGYEPCGKLSVEASCDALGEKHIGRSAAPYGYKNCSSGKRIFISKGEAEKNPRAPFRRPEMPVPSNEQSDPLSVAEESQLKRELEKLEKENKPGLQSLNITNRKELETAIDTLSPDEKKMIEQMFGKNIKTLLKQVPF